MNHFGAMPFFQYLPGQYRDNIKNLHLYFKSEKRQRESEKFDSFQLKTSRFQRK